jgi:methyl-accepting chemotaxis protein
MKSVNILAHYRADQAGVTSSPQIHQVATAAEEQTATTSEISNNMHQITDVVQQTASGAQESSAAANQLAGLAEDLRRIVRQFKL